VALALVEVTVSQGVEIVVAVQGVALLLKALADAGAEIRRDRRLTTAAGETHDVDYVATDASGATVGVKVDARSEKATFVPQDCEGRGAALAGRVAQRYAYSRITEELRRKGYELTKEERQADGSLKLVLTRWR
jgi:hypothetical protein